MGSRMHVERSRSVFEAALEIVPGGVNSPVRAYRSVGGVPPHLVRGEGAWVFDLDGNRYLDLVLAYGPLILGHACPEVTRAIVEAAERGTAFGAPTEGELELARRLVERVPGLEMVRLVNSGTEATMSALRLARAATGRDRAIVFRGGYHGHADSFLVQAGSGALTLGVPDSPGVPAALAALTSVATYNDLGSVEALFDAHPREVACVFVEPVAGNMGCIPPLPGFLEGLRELCDENGALLVFDEVMTGFRVARGGYLERTSVRADLVTLGKVMGGGLPIGAFGGRRELMSAVSPSGPVYQAGTLSGNPLAVAAGIATLDVLDRHGTYEGLEASGEEVDAALRTAAADGGVPLTVTRIGSMIGLHFTTEAVRSLSDVEASDRARWTRFFHAMLARGVLLPPSPFETWFLSTAHDSEALAHLIDAAEASMADLGG